MDNNNLTWGAAHKLLACTTCNGTFLQPQNGTATLLESADLCPYCGAAGLSEIGTEAEQSLHLQPPELLLPFAVAQNTLQENLTRFARQTWFAPADLTPANLAARLQPIYVPMWLVDAQVQARWQAEVGFNYQVVSHKESYQNGQWRTQQVQETRVRWEPRVGALQRPYANQIAPALEEFAVLERTLGKYRLEGQIRPFQPADLPNALAYLPNRPPEDAWPEAQAALKDAAAEECRLAAAANHIREFRWQPQFANQTWTQLLLPLYTSYYQDDEGVARLVYVQGQTGLVRGQRRASMHKARRWSAILAGVAAVIFVLSMLVVLLADANSGLLPAAGGGLVLALLVGVTAVVPLLMAWYTNSLSMRFDAEQQALAEFLRVVKGE